jgi:endoglucanase
MLTMQDGDGGVYHKLTTADFSGMVMPAADAQKRYVVKKSVTAALNLAAVAAYASRTFRKFDAQLPGFADTALAAARRAWDWARANPTAYYIQKDMNAAHAPPIGTGEYGDRNALDEFQWAGAELYLATREDSFYVAAYPTSLPTRIGVPGWNSVGALAFYSMADEGGAEHPLVDTATVRLRLREAATLIRNATDQSAFRVPMQYRDFYWGSNSVCANMGMLLVQAYRATGDASFLRPALDAMDYLLGRNGPGISFVTGFGTRSPLHPHHRPSEADGIAEPVPGFLVGGPNSGQDDKCAYPSTLPALSYSDTECSYASNEVAINWNAPLAYLGGALHALYTGANVPQSIGPSGRAAVRHAALLSWEGNGPRLVMPKGLRGRLEFFDGMGRAWNPGKSGRDSAGTGRKPPALLFFRLHVEGGKGFAGIRTGSWPTAANLRIPL